MKLLDRVSWKCVNTYLGNEYLGTVEESLDESLEHVRGLGGDLLHVFSGVHGVREVGEVVAGAVVGPIAFL